MRLRGVYAGGTTMGRRRRCDRPAALDWRGAGDHVVSQDNQHLHCVTLRSKLLDDAEVSSASRPDRCASADLDWHRSGGDRPHL